MITLVADENAGLLLARSKANLGKVTCCRLQSAGQGRRVAFVGRMDRRRHNDTAIEVDRVFWLVGEMVVPSFILAIFASGSVLLVQSSFESFLPLRLRSSRTMASMVGVATPLSTAIRVSIWR